MDDVRSTREAVVITKRGRPLAKLVPAGGQPWQCVRPHAGRSGDRRGYCYCVSRSASRRLGNLAVILLDTHVLAWLVADENRLSRPARSAIRRARVNDGLAIAPVTLWGLAFQSARGALRTHTTIENTVRNPVSQFGGPCEAHYRRDRRARYPRS